jgi:ribosomal protein L18E
VGDLVQKIANANAEHETAVKALNEGLENQKKAMIAAEAEHSQQTRDRIQEADGQIKQMQTLQ